MPGAVMLTARAGAPRCVVVAIIQAKIAPPGLPAVVTPPAVTSRKARRPVISKLLPAPMAMSAWNSLPAGLTCRKKRSESVPPALIAAGSVARMTPNVTSSAMPEASMVIWSLPDGFRPKSPVWAFN